MKISEQLQPLAISIDKITLDPKNARLHTGSNLKAINALCARHGFQNTILNWYRGADGNVIYACEVK